MPSKAEFEQLIDFVGGGVSGGCALKSTNNAYWLTPNNNNNSSGFSARGSGKSSRVGGSLYSGLKEHATYWTATEGENYTSLANHMDIKYQSCTAIISYVVGVKDSNGYSVRCVKD